MPEVCFLETAVAEPFSYFTLLAQKFTPLFTFQVERVDIDLRALLPFSFARLSIQHCDPAGKPTGTDLVHTHISYPWEQFPLPFKRFMVGMPFFRLVEGSPYALVLRVMSLWPLDRMEARLNPPPAPYPRGNTIRSIDGGSSWQMADLGDLNFGLYGYPPKDPSPYIPPVGHFAIIDISRLIYHSSVCLRVVTAQPCKLVLWWTKWEPEKLARNEIRRGVPYSCVHSISFWGALGVAQKEIGESIYHTFYLTPLMDGQDYWLTFIGDMNAEDSVSQSPVFHYTHVKGSGFTTMRRPDAPGDLCMITNERGDPCPDHWKNVDEAASDENTTCVHASTVYTGWIYRDLYNIPDFDPPDRPIEQVHITARLRRQGGYAYVHLARIGLKVNGIEWWSPDINQIPTTYKNFHLHLYLNPVTGLPWTYSDVNDLQLGIWLRSYRSIGWGAAAWCTQLYCRIYHQCVAYQ